MQKSYLFKKYRLQDRCWLTIDPGTQGLGLALWEGETLKKSRTINSRLSDWLLRSIEIICSFTFTEYSEAPDVAFFEMPFISQHGAAGISSAKNDPIKLSIACGMVLAQIFCPVVPITVMQWKGQLGKKESDRRTKRLLKRHYPKHVLSSKANHELDAIGIGFHILGLS